MVLGRFVAGDPKVGAGVGDSVLDGTGDDVTDPNGFGIFQRAMMGDGTAAKQIASINLAMPSSSIGSTNAAYVRYWLQFCNFGYLEYGLNDFGNQGNTITDSVMRARDKLLIDAGVALGCKKWLRQKLQYRQQSTDSFLTIGAQTPGTGGYGAGWDTGGTADLSNDSLGALVGM